MFNGTHSWLLIRRWVLRDDRTPIQCICPDGLNDIKCNSIPIKCQSGKETYKSGGIIVVDGFGIAEGFQDGIGEQQLLADVLQLVGSTGGGCDVLQDQFGRFRLARTALARDHDHLIGMKIPQGSPRLVSQCIPSRVIHFHH